MKIDDVTISGGCTPRMSLILSFDENPNGNPVVWLSVVDYHSGKEVASAPLNKDAISKLLVYTAKTIGEM